MNKFDPPLEPGEILYRDPTHGELFRFRGEEVSDPLESMSVVQLEILGVYLRLLQDRVRGLLYPATSTVHLSAKNHPLIETKGTPDESS